MQRRRTTLLTSLLLVVLIVLAGCGPRAGGAMPAAPASASDVVVDLPAIYIDFDEDGAATTGGMSLTQAGALIGQRLPDIALGAAVVDQLQEYNIQHLQLVNSPAGLDILVNGLKVPSFGWNAEILSNLSALLSDLGLSVGPAGAVLPLLGTLGTGVVIRLPVAEGQSPIPLMDPRGAEVATRTQESAAAFAEGVGGAPVIQFAVDYKPDGTWTVQDKGAAEWEAILPVGWDGFDMKPATMAAIMGAGIRTLNVDTDVDGIHIKLNDRSLPTITWGSGELVNILELVKQSGILGAMGGNSEQMAGALNLVEQVLPTVQAADFSMQVNFPTQ